MAGTSVLTPTGARAIEALRLGDLVISRDETRQMSVMKPVVRLIRNHHQKILSLTLLGTTALHPFYVRGHGWVKAGDLHAGDEIVSEEGGVLKVRRVQQRAGLADTYNFEVADTHTYFVGTLHAWVHNDCKKGGSEEERELKSVIVNKILEGNRVGSGLKADPSHRGASYLSREQLMDGKVFDIKGGDGVDRKLLQTEGSMNGKTGIFEYIYDEIGNVTHQRFIKDGIINGIPNQRLPRVK